METAALWNQLEFCGYVGTVLFFVAAALIFWKMRVYDSFLFFLREMQRKQKRKKTQKKKKQRRTLWGKHMPGKRKASGAENAARKASGLLCLGMILLLMGNGTVQARDTASAKTQDLTVSLLPLGDGRLVDGVCYYNKGIEGRISLPGDLVIGETQILALPQDEVAREAAKNMGSDFYDEATGSCVVGNWETENVPTGETTIMFTFQMQGRWKISVTGSASGEEAGGNETDENEAGENGANENGGSEEAGNSFCTGESEEFVIDKEAPLLSVTYGNVKDISSARSSGANVNRPIQRGLHQITSPGCEVSAAGTGQVTIRVKEDYFIPENVKITVYKEDYETGEKKDVTKKFERYIVSESRRTADTSAQENRSIRRTVSESAQEDRSIRRAKNESAQAEDNTDGWRQEGDSFVLRYQWEQEGHYQFCVTGEDLAGNVLTAEEKGETAACMDENGYAGPLYTMDNTAPVLRAFTYDRPAAHTWGMRSYFTESPSLIVEIEEENFNRGDFSLQDVQTWADGSMIRPVWQADAGSLVWTSYYEEGKRINRAVLPIREEANHTFSGQAADICGHRSAIRTGECTYDATPPEVEVCVKDADYFIPYRSYQYFGKKKFVISITAKDTISGARTLSYYLKEEGQGGLPEESFVLFQNEKENVRTDDLSEYTREIVIDQEDFRGRICVQAGDFAGWKSAEAESPGLILSSWAVHQKNSRILLELSEADYTDEDRKIKYYRYPIVVTAKGENSHAGVGVLTLHASGQRQTRKDSADNQEKNISSRDEKTDRQTRVNLRERVDLRDKEDVCYQAAASLRLDPAQFGEGDEENPVELEAVLKDNAGHRTTLQYGDYRIVADAEKPEITVTYDTYSAKNGKYYNCARTATITVRDRNFDPSSVRWQISGSNDDYHIGRWTGRGERHQCQVVFSGEGKNYQIKLTAADYAGNQTVWDKDTAFTIDKTPPVIRMEMDTAQAANAFYYRRPQEVRFFVKDKNVNTDTAAVCRQNGEKISVGLTAAGGNRYTAVRTYRKDGKYVLRFRCEDLAGNVTRSENVLRFVIDRTPPEVRAAGVKNGMGYAGEVRPSVTVTDRNLDRNAVYVRLERTDRAETVAANEREYTAPAAAGQSRENNAELVAASEREYIAPAAAEQSWVDRAETAVRRGRQYTWGDFPHEEGADGIYRLQAYARDLAGNQAALGEGITFTVNRYGSVYVLSDSLQDTIEKGYTKSDEGIVITEYSVNPVDTRVTLLKDNQSLRELYPDKTPGAGGAPENQQSVRLGTAGGTAQAGQARISAGGTAQAGQAGISADSTAQVGRTGASAGGYSVLSDRVGSGSRTGWYVKRHYISGENFEEEGTYQITLESGAYVMRGGRKKMIRETSSSLRGVPILFAVDRTPPTVQIGGLEEDMYEEENHSFVITVMDNCAFDHMDVRVRYEGGEKPEKVIRILPEDLGGSHSVVRELEAYEGEQVITYQAWDKAGNCLDSAESGEEIRCVVADSVMMERLREKQEDTVMGAAARQEQAAGVGKAAGQLWSRSLVFLAAALGVTAGLGLIVAAVLRRSGRRGN